jgi:hypothetical protein
MKRKFVFLLSLLVTSSCASSTSHTSSSGGYGGGQSTSGQIIKSIDCVTVLGLNEAREIHYSNGRIEVITMGGQVDISGGGYVRWCSAERAGTRTPNLSNSPNSNSSNSQYDTGANSSDSEPETTVKVVYSSSLECPGISGSFELHRSRTSPLKCSYTMPDGRSGFVTPIMNGRRGSPLKTDGMTAVDYKDFETICFGLFDDGQVVVASKTIPVSSSATCKEWFASNTAPSPFATSFTCPPSGQISDLELSGGDESNRCVVQYADGSKKTQPLGNSNHHANLISIAFNFMFTNFAETIAAPTWKPSAGDSL